MNYDDLTPVEITVMIWVKPESDIQEIISEMDYNFAHPNIVDTEIRGVNTEL